MSSLVLELQAEAMRPDGSVTALLRKALAVATKLDIADFAGWARKELNGYEVLLEIPEYRKIRGMAQVRTPRGYQPLILTAAVADVITTIPLGQRIGELEDLCKGGDSLRFAFNHERQELLIRDLTQGLMPSLLISRAVVVSVIDQVRSHVLEWALKLEKLGVLGDGLSFSEHDKNVVSGGGITNNFFGSIHNSPIQQGAVLSPQNTSYQGMDVDAIGKFVQQMQSALVAANENSIDVSEIRVQLDTIAAQLRSTNPKAGVVRECLASVRAILEGAAGSILATAAPNFAEKLPALLVQLKALMTTSLPAIS